MLRPTLIRQAARPACRAASASPLSPSPSSPPQCAAALLPALSEVCFRRRPAPPLPARAPPAQRRCFSASPQAPVKVLFEPTDSAELDETLSTILHKIILPSRLPEKQRSLVFDPERRQYLLENPVVIEVEDYEYRFPTLDVKKGEVPATREVFWKALRQMRSRRDWANFGTLLFGLREAGRKWEPAEEAKMIRLAAEAGQPFPVIDAARQWVRTGLRLNSPEKVLQTLWGVCMMAVEAGWDDEAAWRRAMRWGEMVEELAQETPHWAIGPGMHRNPVAQALLLFPVAHLAKMRAGNVNNDDDVVGVLRRRIRLILLLWPPGRGITDTFSPKAYKNRVSGMAVLRDPTQQLVQGSLAATALATARALLEASSHAPEDDKWNATKHADDAVAARKLKKIEVKIMGELRGLYGDDSVRADKGRAVYDKTVRALGLDPLAPTPREPSKEHTI